MGARPLRRVIQQKVEDALSDDLLSGTFKEGDTVEINIVEPEEEDGEARYRVAHRSTSGRSF